jgi:hypothetical protein
MKKEDRDFLYTMYNSKLVDEAIELTSTMFSQDSFDLLEKYSHVIANNELTQKLKEAISKGEEVSGIKVDEARVKEIMYEKLQYKLAWIFLTGAKHALENKLTEDAIEVEEQHFATDFRKNLNFAVMFAFSDNDFSISIEEGASLFCERFNNLLSKIDSSHEDIRDIYIDEIDKLCEVESIKEIMKCGFATSEMKRYGYFHFTDFESVEDAFNQAKDALNYIPWDKTKNVYKSVGGEVVKTGETNRFITGTQEEILKAIAEISDSPYENPDGKDFPYWCNGEVVVLYVKNGYLTYVIR